MHGVGVVGPGSVQDVLVLLHLALGPLAVRWPTVLGHTRKDGQQTEGGDGLLVEDVQLVADGGDGQAGGGGEDGGLGDQGVARNSVEN